MRRIFLYLSIFLPLLTAHNQNAPITKSTALFTQASSATAFNYEAYKADGIFWGHMPHNSIESDQDMNNWADYVSTHTNDGKYFFGRGEFDWGWYWMIDFMDDPDSYWAMDLDSNYIPWAGGGNYYQGHEHGWQSHHGPDFLAWLKYQVDRMVLAPVTHMMFDSQTSATRTLHWLGGDFSVHSMAGFRTYLENKYSPSELSALGIADMSTFNYQNFLLDQGFTLSSYRNEAYSIEGNIPFYKDFVYFQRRALNEVMEELFDYIDTMRPGIEIGATTNLVEPRGYIFSDRLTYLAGEFFHPYDPAVSPPFKPILHFKAAEATDKTLIYFPYPDAFRSIRDRNAPRQCRGWIAQAYAMGSIFGIPGNVWIPNSPTWDPGAENLADLYVFIHDNSHLLDNYRALSNAALPYSVYASLLEAGMDGSYRARQSVQYLIEENISFDLQIFGDPDEPIAPTSEQLGEYDVIITDSDAQYYTTEQNQILDSVRGKVVSISEINDIKNRLSWKIDVLKQNVLSNDLISALPRISTDSEAPYTLHLLNRKYNAQEDTAQLHEDVSLQIPANVFPNPIQAARLHRPGTFSTDLALQTDIDGIITLDIGDFESCWGIVELAQTEFTPGKEINCLTDNTCIYPNPARNDLYINVGYQHAISSFEVYSLQGKLVMNTSVEANPVDISMLPEGIYIIKMEVSGQTLIEKLIKQ